MFKTVQNILIHRKIKLTLNNLLRTLSNSIVKNNCQRIQTMKILNVAEKNDAAKNIAGHLSRGTAQRREGLSKFNKIYEFQAQVLNQNCKMVMTSVSGHLLNYEFVGNYRKWYGCSPQALFDAPVVKQCPEASYDKIKKSLEKEIKTCNALIIWTDCDREGENIGFEIIQVCKAVKPNIQVYRAKFSEITQISVERALRNLEQPNKAISDAVDVRSELDLRIGAAFTRFQTLRLQKVFPITLAELLISYGPCQFPTLGFVVERFLAIERFQPEPYWKLRVTHFQNDLNVEFRWARNRLFEKLPCEIFLEICQDNPEATVKLVTSKPKSKWRPLPLDTIELEKQGSRKLRLSAKETMKIAEKLYTQGFISYPRTETNIFPKEMNLESLVTLQAVETAGWGRFAQQLMTEGITPRQGKKTDQAHPPIHPTKFTNTLQGNEAKVYEFIVRHFLACLSKNAEGFETIVEIEIAGENFVTNGLQIVAKNYLDVYIYEKWNTKEIHVYELGQTFMPTSIEMLEEKTSPPNLLTEADLIALMDKHGIGTDATHAEHIETIKSRKYVGLKDTKYLIPGKLGIGLVMGYDRMGFQMSKPHLRAELENDLKLICDRQKEPDEVRQHQISKYREVFQEAAVKANMIDDALAEYLNEQPTTIENVNVVESIPEIPIIKCPKCNSNMVLKTKKQNSNRGCNKYIGCMSYPTCNNVVWFPEGVENIEVLEDGCTRCSNVLKKIKVKFTRNIYPIFGMSYSTCIGGCDPMFNNSMGIKMQSVNDTGYESSVSLISSTSHTSNARSRNQNQSISRNDSLAASWGVSNNGNNQNRSTNSWNQNINSNAQSTQFSSNNRNNQNRVTNSWNENINHNVQNIQSSSNNVSNNTNFNFDNGNQGDIMCNCHQLAKQLTVRKAGPNQGRIFYKCFKPVGEDCNFFLWGPEENNTETDNRPTVSINNRNDNWNPVNTDNGRWNNESEIMCNCGNAAKKLTVQKEGVNKGRQFYGCPAGPNSPCNFFQWAEDNDSNAGTQNNWGTQSGQGRGRGRGSSSSRARSSSTTIKSRTTNTGGTKRKCSVCSIEGHTKRTCPNNPMN